MFLGIEGILNRFAMFGESRMKFMSSLVKAVLNVLGEAEVSRM